MYQFGEGASSYSSWVSCLPVRGLWFSWQWFRTELISNVSWHPRVNKMFFVFQIASTKKTAKNLQLIEQQGQCLGIHPALVFLLQDAERRKACRAQIIMQGWFVYILLVCLFLNE